MMGDAVARTDCIEDNRQAPVNVSENHLASLEMQEIFKMMKFQKSFIHQAHSYKFPKRKFGSTVTIITE